MRAAWLIAAALACVGCAGAGAPPPRAAAGAATLQPELSLAERLRSVDGTFAWDRSLRRYVFDRKHELSRMVDDHADNRTLEYLANCVADTSPSMSRLDGKVLPLGVLCLEALTLLIYVEPARREWPGYAPPNSSPRRLQAAQQAWAEVIRSGSYKQL